MLDLIKLREDLHQIPELAFREYKTQAYIEQILSKYKELKLHKFPTTGLLVEYSPVEGSYLLFRADMDGLPLTEKTQISYSSKHKGCMHACGHDIHMTVLTGLIERVITSKLQRNLLFIYQPAEEGEAGAASILKDSIWEKFTIEAAYALHVSPDLKPGIVSSRVGNFFSATGEFDVKIKGQSAHIATPERGKNALEAGMEIYNSVRQLPRLVKSKEKFICDFGVLRSGQVRNTLPDECLMSGTMRAKDQKSIRALKASVISICQTVSAAYGVKAEAQFLAEYRQVTNDTSLVRDLQSAAEVLGLEYIEAERTSAGEDFGFFTERWPGLLFWLGAQEGRAHPLHSEYFLPSAKAVKYGIDIFYQLINQKSGT